MRHARRYFFHYCIYYFYVLTHDFQLYAIAVTIALDVRSHARVVASLRSIDSPESKTILLYDDTVVHVLLNNIRLRSDNNKKKEIKIVE